MAQFRFKQIKESCLYVQDLDKTAAFYHGVLGLDIIARIDNQHIFFRVGSSVLLCFIPEQSKKKTTPPGHFAYGIQHLAFEVPFAEYEYYKQLAVDSGIDIIHKEQWGNRYESFYFTDPDGHILEIVPEGMWDE